MGKVIVFGNAYGGISVCRPTAGTDIDEVVQISVPHVLVTGGEMSIGLEFPVQVNAGDYVDPRIAEANGLESKQIPFAILDEDEVPDDRIFRESWILSGETVEEDLETARSVAHSKRRAWRDLRFKVLDAEVVINMTNPEKLAEAEGRRQDLRDVDGANQQKIDQAETTQELRAILGEAGII